VGRQGGLDQKAHGEEAHGPVGKAPPAAARRIQETTASDFMEYSDFMRNRAAGMPVNTIGYKRKFGASYLYYYTSLMQRQ